MDEWMIPDRETLKHLNIAVIREIYDGENSNEVFEIELEKALEMNCTSIIIEPANLGQGTAQWIALGNCLHKTSVLTGFGAILSSFVWPDKVYISFPLAGISLFSTGLYTACWQFDPCCKYQVEKNLKNLEKLPLHSLASSKPVVLVRKDDKRRIVLHIAITLIAVAFCSFRIFKSFKTD